MRQCGFIEAVHGGQRTTQEWLTQAARPYLTALQINAEERTTNLSEFRKAGLEVGATLIHAEQVASIARQRRQHLHENVPTAPTEEIR